MTDGLKMALTIGLITVLVAVGLLGANRAKVATENSGTEVEGIVESVSGSLDWDS